MTNKKLLLNGTKLIYHLNSLNAWLKGKNIYPVLIEISPVGYCNQSCIFCAYEYLKRNPAKLETTRTLKILKEFSQVGVKAVFFSGEGEPLLHPDLDKMIQYASSLGLDCALNTNGILLDRDCSQRILPYLQWVRFSINAGTAESYSRIHKAPKREFFKLIQNLKDAVGVKKKNNLNVSLGVQLVYIGQPYSEIKGFVSLLKKIGMDYFALKQFNKHPLSKFKPKISNPALARLSKIETLSNDHFSAVIREGFDQTRQERVYRRCFGFDFFSEIKSDGGVYPCGPLLGIKRFCYGDIYKNSFTEIWKSKKRKMVLEDIIRNLDIKKCMPNCRLHAINDFLWRLRHPPAHVNFI